MTVVSLQPSRVTLLVWRIIEFLRGHWQTLQATKMSCTIKKESRFELPQTKQDQES